MIDLSECRILIVDDVKANIDILVRLLKDEHKLSVALNGEAALKAAEKIPPDLVLLDIVMPGIDGFEVCRRIRANPATAEVPVMFLSSLDEVGSKTQGFEAGGNDYLVKPFEALEVRARVRGLLKAKAYSDSVKQKIARELQIAKEIQGGILKQNVQDIVDGTGLACRALMEPAREVGGDFYDVIRLPQDRVAIVVGDVSGKGIPAALFMAVSTTLARWIAKESPCPARILAQINTTLLDQNPKSMFVTMGCAIIDKKAGVMKYASGGHPSPVLLRKGQAPSLPYDSTGPVVGVIEDATFESYEVPFHEGDTLVFYTDGITEAMNAEGELFGDARLLECLAHPGEPLDLVCKAVASHAGDFPQSDDMTLVSVMG